MGFSSLKDRSGHRLGSLNSTVVFRRLSGKYPTYTSKKTTLHQIWISYAHTGLGVRLKLSPDPCPDYKSRIVCRTLFPPDKYPQAYSFETLHQRFRGEGGVYMSTQGRRCQARGLVLLNHGLHLDRKFRIIFLVKNFFGNNSKQLFYGVGGGGGGGGGGGVYMF